MLASQTAQSSQGSSLADLADEFAKYELDPLGFVYFAFPWGDSSLKAEAGPDAWQIELLTRIRDQLQYGGDNGAIIREAVRAAHGVGKSALVAWLILWAISTHPDTRGVVTAMTADQLKQKTWAELAKWHEIFIGRELFSLKAESLSIASERASRTWRIDAAPWSVHASSAFAGMHNKGKRILCIYDEASEIDDRIWEISEGALTDEKTQIIWCVFGNPTKTSGRFYAAFADRKSTWGTLTVSAEESRFSNKELLKRWENEYGRDSDFYRVRALGLPPRAGVSNFIAPELVENARRREIHPASYQMYPKVMGLDPAAFGDNFSIISIRQGPQLIRQWGYSGLDGPDLASRVVEIWHQNKDITECYVDGIGIGADVCSSLSRVPGFPLVRVNVSMPAGDDETYHNLRAQLWGRMRKWLETACIPNDDELAEQLTSLDYGFDGKSRIQMQSKDDLRRLGRPSPDKADSLSLTFFGESINRKPSQQVMARPVTRRAVVW